MTTISLYTNDNQLIISTHKTSDYFIFTDSLGRKWKLQPINNSNISMPFIITPLYKEENG